jgi:hypothetical protein
VALFAGVVFLIRRARRENDDVAERRRQPEDEG